MHESQVTSTATITAATISNSGRAATLTTTQGPATCPSLGVPDFCQKQHFAARPFVLPDDTCADAMLQSMAAAKTANSILVVIAHSFPDGPI
jgi:hypothetical protein